MPDAPVGTRTMLEGIEGYRIVEKLAEGGMAVVYRARQEAPARTVAIKVIKPDVFSEAAKARFQQEIDSLGRFQHPGIAQIHDAGTLGDQPYFVMELIEGLPLTEYADAEQLGVRERVALVRAVCAAVQHAHERGVIHRDLKPSNILVDTSGQPKVLDFGLARMTESDVQITSMRTSVGQLVGTLAYMSPEQASAAHDLDVRTDVYSLGVVLYELLTGAFPYDVHQAMIHEVVRVIREVEPSPLSSHRRVLRGDLDTVATKALAKERARRYPSAAALGADLDRFLDDQPVAARRPSVIYQLTKFSRRHKALVGASAAILLTLVVGSAIALHFALEARSEGRRAERQAAITATIGEFLNHDLLGALDPRRSRGDPVSLREAVDRATARLDGRFDGEPEVEAGIRQTLGSVYSSLGELETAEEQLRRSLAVVPAGVTDRPYEPALLRLELGRVCFTLGKRAEAEELLTASAAELEERHGEGERLAVCLEALGVFLRFENRIAEARVKLERASAIFASLGLAEHDSAIRARKALADIARLDGDRREALAMLQEIHAAQRLRLGEDHPDTLRTLEELTSLQIDLLELEAAEVHCGLLHDLGQRVYHAEHPIVAKAIYLQGRVHQERGELEIAERKFRRALELYEADEGAHPLARLDVLFKLGEAQRTLHGLAVAQEPFGAALELSTRLYGTRHLSTAQAQIKLADVHLQARRVARSRELLDEAIATCRELAPNGNDLSIALNTLAFVHQAQGELEQAEECLREVLDRVRADVGDEDPRVATILENLANILSSRGRAQESVELLNQTLDLRRKALGEKHEAVGRTLGNLCVIHRALRDYPAAIDCGLASIEILIDRLGLDHFTTRQFVGETSRALDEAIRADPDVRFELDPARIDGLFERGLEHPLLEELAARLP